MFRSPRLLCVLGLLILIAALRPAYAQPVDPYRLKCGYFSKLPSYITWPGEAPKTVVLGVLGDGPSDEALDELSRRSRDGTVRIEVVRVTEDELDRPLHIVFVAGQDDDAQKRLQTVLERLADRPVLVAAEFPGAAQAGACLNFVPHEGGIKFEINRKAAERAKLALSAQLLKVAVKTFP